MALRSLASHRLRSGLAILGIVIGVSAVIMMLAMGQGAQRKVTKSISGLGVNLLFVYPGREGRHGAGLAERAQTLTLEDAESMTRLQDVVAVAPDVGKREVPIEYLNTQTTADRVVGTSQEYQWVRDYPVATGRFLEKDDVVSTRRVCVLGHRIAQDLFGAVEPVGRWLFVEGRNFEIVGVMAEKGSQGAWLDFDRWLYVPVTTMQQRLMTRRRHLDQIIVSVSGPDRMDAMEEEIRRILRQRHRLGTGDEDDFNVEKQTEMLQRLGEITRAFTLLLAGIAVVSLLVGGIGIMNVMLMSVLERTREIGIRKAVGARRRDILRQFLIEALAISLLGGTIGILLGVSGTFVIPKLPIWQQLSSGEWESVISPLAIALAFGFSCAIGLFFGIYPAYKAARLNPVEALRYE
jgi:putative ABC transport system permease protein